MGRGKFPAVAGVLGRSCTGGTNSGVVTDRGTGM